MLDNKGFTLIEVVIAFAIILIGLLGLLKSVEIAFEHNLRNHQRDEVVRVAERVMNDMRSSVFDSEPTTPITIPSKMRGGNTQYVVRRSVDVITAGQTNQYRVDVRYKFGNFSTYHSVVSVRGK